MECRAVVSSLSDYIDMWLSESEVREIESHLVACPKCQTVSLDLNEIKSAAQELPQHTPNRALWSRIVKEIEPDTSLTRETSLDNPAARENPEPSWWERLNSRRFSLTLPQLASISAVIAALVIMTTVSLIRPTGKNIVIPGPQVLQTALLPDEARIKAELESRLSVINLRKANWDPTIRAEFERHLNKIDNSLRSSREILQINPEDSVQQQMVLTLYNEKLQLLEDVERFNW